MSSIYGFSIQLITNSAQNAMCSLFLQAQKRSHESCISNVWMCVYRSLFLSLCLLHVAPASIVLYSASSSPAKPVDVKIMQPFLVRVALLCVCFFSFIYALSLTLPLRRSGTNAHTALVSHSAQKFECFSYVIRPG